MSDEVGSLAGVRRVSHERSRHADFPRRQGLWSRHAGPYPSNFCGCVSWYALLARGHRCGEAVTARNANSVDAFERGQSFAPTPSEEPCGRSGFRKRARPRFLLSKKPPILQPAAGEMRIRVEASGVNFAVSARWTESACLSPLRLGTSLQTIARLNALPFGRSTGRARERLPQAGREREAVGFCRPSQDCRRRTVRGCQ